MTQSITLIAYSILLCVAVVSLIKTYKKSGILNSFVFFQSAFLVYYVIIPIITILIISFTPDNLNRSLLRASQVESISYYYACLYTYISYFAFALFYKITSSKVNKNTLYDKTNNCEKTEKNGDVENEYYKISKYKKSLKWGIITLSFGLFAEILVSISLGGIFSAIAMGEKLRAYGIDMGTYIPQNRLFSVVLMVSSLASTYFFVYSYRLKKGFIVSILLIISILASTFYLFINAGRLGILLFLMTFFIDFSFRKFKRPFIIIFFSMVLFVLLLGTLDDLFFYLSYGYVKESSTSIYSIVNEFAFPYVNLLNVQSINDIYGLRWGTDYFTWIINIVPTSILSLFGLSKVTTGYHFITDYFIGNSASGGIPTDILTLGLRQFGVLSLVLQSAILGILCKYFDKVIEKIHSKEYYFMTLRISSIMFIIVPYADLDSFIRNRYDMILVLIFAIIISKQVNKRKKILIKK
ncbi:O-antigen polymerase [Paenibacillus camelliae]|uniref:O-antigen polymerase n=1 Tax=Paenibacillus camelliae TaxID=512410 RepID=UPI00203AD7B0|nr:O-antigen polymerase [Paenibacillus camelliae]MCM3633970.1 oligosaccharide repeat unit polymerase [Paenibacillus camelliae]